jgi:hypothetical protein
MKFIFRFLFFPFFPAPQLRLIALGFNLDSHPFVFLAPHLRLRVASSLESHIPAFFFSFKLQPQILNLTLSFLFCCTNHRLRPLAEAQIQSHVFFFFLAPTSS